jgi:opacity protein-like surface antigen
MMLKKLINYSKKSFRFSIMLMLSNTSIANTLDLTQWWHPVVTASAGVALAKVGESQSVNNVNDFTQYYYQVNNSYSTQLLLGAFVGTEIVLQPQYAVQVGLGFYQPSVFNTRQGTLTQGVDAASADQYQFSYNVKSRQLLLEGKFMWLFHENYRAYITAGIGPTFNNVYGYKANILPYTSVATFTPLYSNQQQTAFSYAAGLGVEMDIAKNWRVGLGYKFTDLGRANPGSGMIDTSYFSGSLTQQHLYAQEIMTSLSYLIG